MCPSLPGPSTEPLHQHADPVPEAQSDSLGLLPDKELENLTLRPKNGDPSGGHQHPPETRPLTSNRGPVESLILELGLGLSRIHNQSLHLHRILELDPETPVHSLPKSLRAPNPYYSPSMDGHPCDAHLPSIGSLHLYGKDPLTVPTADCATSYTTCFFNSPPGS